MSAALPSSPSSVSAPALVQFQLGLFREVVRVPAGNLSYRHARRLAAEIIERKSSCCSASLTKTSCGTEDLIEVIVAGSATVTEMRIRPHSLVGLKCDGCGLDFHKRCAYLLPNGLQSGSSTGQHQPLPVAPPAAPLTLPVPPGRRQSGGDQHDEALLQTPVLGRGPRCGWCRVRGTPARLRFLTPSTSTATPSPTCASTATGCSGGSSGRACSAQTAGLTAIGAASCSSPETVPERGGPPTGRHGGNLGGGDVRRRRVHRRGPAGRAAAGGHESVLQQLHPLMRLVQSVHHSKRRAGGVLREGWLLHHTNTGHTEEASLLDRGLKEHHSVSEREQHQVLQRCATERDVFNHSYLEISLSEVLQVRGPPPTSPCRQANSGHTLEVETAALVFCVAAGDEASVWESAIRQALMPVQSSIMIPEEDSMTRVLGSGQFGVVYKGTHRMSGRPVAIKVIDKTRFAARQRTQLRNEVAILQYEAAAL
ncbi:hypothetical protein KUCAC02_000552 [Chaenocephalus aceratus]|uniref:Uncharacterized protein n=1 Tax=Chaenocephalus aceratus TaxID=36190 RepID=A0ACB9W670_CHAAC|nr:hypothetical protein KUCAC02_000552 [Chaenocephalus aceratus]